MITTLFRTRVWTPSEDSLYGALKIDGLWRPNLRTNKTSGDVTSGVEWQAKVMGGGAMLGAASTGTATTAPTATTVTLDGVSAPGSTTAFYGQMITMGAAWATIVTNTNAAPPVCTIDGWHDPTNYANVVTTPAAGRWIILPGQAPAGWLALSNGGQAPSIQDTILTGELTSTGLKRHLGTWSHTGGTNNFQWVYTYTADGTYTINPEGVFNTSTNVSGGSMPFESAEPSPPTVVSGDTVQQTVQVTY